MPSGAVKDSERTRGREDAFVPLSHWANEELSVFESMRVYEGVIFMLDEHIRRLFMSARTAGVRLSMTESEIKKRLLEEVRKEKTESGFLRITVASSNVWIRVFPLPERPSEHYRRGIRLGTWAVVKAHLRASVPQVKCSDYLTGVLATADLVAGHVHGAGFDESLFLNASGYVEEGRTNNIFMVTHRVLKTPPSVGALDGVTRRIVMQLGEARARSVEECPFTRHELYTADEAFLTHTSGEIVPVREVDGRKIGGSCPGEMTERLSDDFKNRVRRYIRANRSTEK